MIVLLNCSINLLASDVNVYEVYGDWHSPVECDSVMIAFDDLRIVNSKLIELKYQKEVNTKLKEVINNDNQIIENYKLINDNVTKDCKKAVRERNIFIGVSVFLLVTGAILLVVK